MSQNTVVKELLGKDRPILKRRKSINVRSYLWQIIRLSVTRCAMASWGLPFEAIAASMLLRDRKRRKERPEEKEG